VFTHRNASKVKANLSSTTKTRLVRGAFYVLLLLAVCVIPFALAQRTTEGQSTFEITPHVAVSSSNRDQAIGSLRVPQFPAGSDFPAGDCQCHCGLTLYDQYNNAATQPPLGIGSQQFEPTMAAFNDQAADDFVLGPDVLYYVILTVNVMGEYSAGGGPASSFNVFFYTNGPGNLPGTQIAALLNQPYSGTPPNFSIDLGDGVGLARGTYWISVQAVQNFNPNGQWFWHNRTVQSNAGAAWQNPGDGYGTGCLFWNRKNACMPDQVWPDQVFSLVGCALDATPTPTPSWTPTATATFTPTATATPMARPTQTPRSRPTPAPRP